MLIATNAATALSSARGRENRKITVFSLEQDFVNSTNPGFFVAGASVKVRQDGQTWQLEINDRGQFNEVPAQLDAMCRIISHIHQHQSYLLGGVEV